jgi:mannose-6-phosphate isomerase
LKGVTRKLNAKINKPTRIEKPWGYELIFAHTEKYAGKILFVKKGCKLSLQYHHKKDESIYVQSGKINIRLGGADGQMVLNQMNSSDCVRIEPLTRHRIEALEDTTLFEVSTPELNDVQRLEDDYGRI